MSESNGNTNRDFSIFDNMSTEALEEILRSDFQLLSEEDFDVDAILYITEVIAEREKENPTGKFTDVHTAWASFNENYLPYIKDDKSLYDFDDTNTDSGIESTPFITARDKNSKLRGRGLIRVACVTAAIIAVLFTGTLTAYALGFDLWEAVAQWTRDTFGFATVESTQPEANEYNSLQEALDDFGITEALAPTWIPDGYSLYSIDISETPVKRVFIALYQKENAELTVSITDVGNGADITIEKDDSNVNIYGSGGIDHYIMSNFARTKAVWLNNTF